MNAVDWRRVDADLAALTPAPGQIDSAIQSGVARGAARFRRRLNSLRLLAVVIVTCTVAVGFTARDLIHPPVSAPTEEPGTSPSRSEGTSATNAPTSSSTGGATGSPTTATSSPVSVSPPGAPQILGQRGAPGSVILSVGAPTDTGGGAITRYESTCTSGDGGVTGTATGGPDLEAGGQLTVSDLTNGASYTCTVVAVNAAGPGPPSTPSAQVVPLDRPGPPGITDAVRGPTDGSIRISFTPPTNIGGTAITSYEATCTSSNGGGPGQATAAAVDVEPVGELTVRGLSTTATYTCTVVAVNSVGPGPPSTASQEVAPAVG